MEKNSNNIDSSSSNNNNNNAQIFFESTDHQVNVAGNNEVSHCYRSDQDRTLQSSSSPPSSSSVSNRIARKNSDSYSALILDQNLDDEKSLSVDNRIGSVINHLAKESFAENLPNFSGGSRGLDRNKSLSPKLASLEVFPSSDRIYFSTPCLLTNPSTPSKLQKRLIHNYCGDNGDGRQESTNEHYRSIFTNDHYQSIDRKLKRDKSPNKASRSRNVTRTSEDYRSIKRNQVKQSSNNRAVKDQNKSISIGKDLDSNGNDANEKQRFNFETEVSKSTPPSSSSSPSTKELKEKRQKELINVLGTEIDRSKLGSLLNKSIKSCQCGDGGHKDHLGPIVIGNPCCCCCHECQCFGRNEQNLSSRINVKQAIKFKPMPSKQILDIESTEKDLILANQTTKKLNLSVETDQNQNVLDRFGCQNQPFAQILMTLKEQNQNFIKEIKNLRLQLEDAEGDLKLVQCQMRSMSKQIFSSASSSSPSKKSKSMRSSNLGNENCDSNTKDVKNEKNEDCSTLIDQTQIAELHNYREKLRHLEENFRSVLQEKERLQSKYDQLQSKMINSMTSVRSSMDDQDVELNRSPKKSSINDQNEIINNHQQSRQKFDNMIEINRNLSKENDQLLLENRYLKRKIDNDDEERCLLLDRLASYRELIDLHRRDDDLYEQRLLSDILPTNSGYDPVTCDIFKLNRNNITSGDGQGRRRDDDDEEVEEIAIGDRHQQKYRSTLKSPYNDYDQHRDYLIENRFVSDPNHRNNEINDNQLNKITTNAVAKNIDDKNIEDDNDERRIMTIGGDENQLIQIGIDELNSSKTTILKSFKSNESIRNEDIGIDRFNSIDLHQRIEKMIAFDSINKMKVNKSNQIYLWHLLLATFQDLRSKNINLLRSKKTNQILEKRIDELERKLGNLYVNHNKTIIHNYLHQQKSNQILQQSKELEQYRSNRSIHSESNALMSTVIKSMSSETKNISDSSPNLMRKLLPNPNHNHHHHPQQQQQQQRKQQSKSPQHQQQQMKKSKQSDRIKSPINHSNRMDLEKELRQQELQQQQRKEFRSRDSKQRIKHPENYGNNCSEFLQIANSDPSNCINSVESNAFKTISIMDQRERDSYRMEHDDETPTTLDSSDINTDETFSNEQINTVIGFTCVNDDDDVNRNHHDVLTSSRSSIPLIRRSLSIEQQLKALEEDALNDLTPNDQSPFRIFDLNDDEIDLVVENNNIDDLIAANDLIGIGEENSLIDISSFYSSEIDPNEISSIDHRKSLCSASYSQNLPHHHLKNRRKKQNDLLRTKYHNNTTDDDNDQQRPSSAKHQILNSEKIY